MPSSIEASESRACLRQKLPRDVWGDCTSTELLWLQVRAGSAPSAAGQCCTVAASAPSPPQITLLFLLARFHSKACLCVCFFMPSCILMPSPQEHSVVADLPCRLIKKSIRVASGRKLLLCRGTGVPAAHPEGCAVPQRSQARSVPCGAVAQPAPPKHIAAGGSAVAGNGVGDPPLACGREQSAALCT